MTEKKYSTAIFFENEHTHVLSVGALCSAIKIVKITGNDPLPEVPWPFLDHFTAPLRGNPYLELMQILFKGEKYDERSGIGPDAIKEYNDWNHETETLENRAVLLDWDRTITKVEGLFLPFEKTDLFVPFDGEDVISFFRARRAMLSPDMYEKLTNFTTKITTTDILTYLCETPERMEYLKTTIRSMRTPNTDVVILTNNLLGVYESFRRLVHELCGPAIVICSGIRGKGNKGVALTLTPEFENLCTTRKGGGRKKSRHIQKRRKTRRTHRKMKMK
jgi:hypothetical protein